MTYEIPDLEPVRIVAGDTVKWTKSLADYLPADGWVLSYAFVCATDQLTKDATDNGDGSFLTTLSSADTAGLNIGMYAWQAYVTKSTERHTVGEGQLEVLANFAGTGYSSGYDARSSAKKYLDALEARLQGRITADQESLSIDGISIARIPFIDVVKLYQEFRGLYAAEVAAERRRRGLPANGPVRVRF